MDRDWPHSSNLCLISRRIHPDPLRGTASNLVLDQAQHILVNHCPVLIEIDSLGLNPNARLTGEMLEDEGVMGTIHIGIGTSHTLGGEIVAPTHYDLIMWEPTIRVDDQIVQA